MDSNTCIKCKKTFKCIAHNCIVDVSDGPCYDCDDFSDRDMCYSCERQTRYMNSTEIRQLSKLSYGPGNFQKLTLEILADMMERLENLDSRLPVVHKPYYESKEIG